MDIEKVVHELQEIEAWAEGLRKRCRIAIRTLQAEVRPSKAKRKEQENNKIVLDFFAKRFQRIEKKSIIDK